MGIRLGKPTPFYLDSMSTVFVAQNEAAAKKSAWILRRIAVLHEGVELDEIHPMHVNEAEEEENSEFDSLDHGPDNGNLLI